MDCEGRPFGSPSSFTDFGDGVAIRNPRHPGRSTGPGSVKPCATQSMCFRTLSAPMTTYFKLPKPQRCSLPVGTGKTIADPPRKGPDKAEVQTDVG